MLKAGTEAEKYGKVKNNAEPKFSAGRRVCRRIIYPESLMNEPKIPIIKNLKLQAPSGQVVNNKKIVNQFPLITKAIAPNVRKQQNTSQEDVIHVESIATSVLKPGILNNFNQVAKNDIPSDNNKCIYITTPKGKTIKILPKPNSRIIVQPKSDRNPPSLSSQSTKTALPTLTSKDARPPRPFDQSGDGKTANVPKLTHKLQLGSTDTENLRLRNPLTNQSFKLVPVPNFKIVGKLSDSAQVLGNPRPAAPKKGESILKSRLEGPEPTKQNVAVIKPNTSMATSAAPSDANVPIVIINSANIPISNIIKPGLMDAPQKTLTCTSKQVSIGALPKRPMRRVPRISQCTQTAVVCNSVAVQTDEAPPRLRDDADPNFMELVEYILDTPKYSDTINASERQHLIKMSKNIRTKAMASAVSHSDATLKTSLFVALRDCVVSDDNGNLSLHKAVVTNNHEMVAMQCLVLSVRSTAFNYMDFENFERLRPIQLAIIHNCDINIFRTLLKHKVKLDVLDSDSNSVFHLAVEYSTDQVLELLLQHCKNLAGVINKKNDDGVTPLILAVVKDRLGPVKLLLLHGADPNIQDEKSGRTAVFHAIEKDRAHIIHALIDFKADLRVCTFIGISAQEAAKDLNVLIDCPSSATTTGRKRNCDVEKEWYSYKKPKYL